MPDSHLVSLFTGDPSPQWRALLHQRPSALCLTQMKAEGYGYLLYLFEE